jgi:ABC-type uncharacterized transport system ATPase subunit
VGNRIVANFKVTEIKSQVRDRILIKNTDPVTSITSLAEVYMVNCRSEGKLRVMIEKYQDKLKCFACFNKLTNIPMI